jgi:hypothetical protein
VREQKPQERSYPSGSPETGVAAADLPSQPGTPARGGASQSAPSNGRAGLPGPRRLTVAPRGGIERRKAAWVAIVVASVVIGGVALAGRGGPSTPVLAAAHAMAPGDTVRSSDLTVLDIRATGGAATIPAARRSAVVGQQVTGPMAAGTLLSPSSVAPGPQLGPGEVGIALALDPDRAAQGILAAGQSVLIVGQQAGSGLPLSVPARVLGILAGSSTSPKVVVDLALTNQADAGAVAAAFVAPAGVRLVVVPRG